LRLATTSQMQEIERRTLTEFGISAELLMECAGNLAAQEILRRYPVEAKRALIVCGPGHNGGDGLVVARHLLSQGCLDIKVWLVRESQSSSSDLYQKQLARFKKISNSVLEIDQRSDLQIDLQSCELVVDALFGTGLSREIQGIYKTVIENLNHAKKKIISLDTPSGLDTNRGLILGCAIQADRTFTFGLAKPGFFVNQGPACVGKLKIFPIGFSAALVKEIANSHFALSRSQVRKLLPKRNATVNKTDQGRALILAGQPVMEGAGLLSSSAAYRIGAGYVTLASWQRPSLVLRDQPEILTEVIGENLLAEKTRIGVPKWDAVAIGPGLGAGPETLKLLEKLKDLKIENVVVDADAITALALAKFKPLPEWVITPHAGELSRILKVDAKEIEADRYSFALRAAKQLGCTVLLKGFHTVLALNDRVWVIPTGNSALAKAGSGDVLTGMIAGFMAQKCNAFEAALMAAYIHGDLADQWLRDDQSRLSLLPSDLLHALPAYLARIENGSR
jgi:hydroxyethylthiazole kinase-like uncharacterized protein yjeF